MLTGRHIPDPFKPKREPSYWHDWIVGMPGFLLVGALNAAAILVIFVLIYYFNKTSWATDVVWVSVRRGRLGSIRRATPPIYWWFFNIASFIPLLGWGAAIEGYGWQTWRAQVWLALGVLALLGQVVVLCSLL